MKRLLIANARLVNESEVREADVLIEDDRIAIIGSQISAPDDTDVIDSAGKYGLPGMMEDPG